MRDILYEARLKLLNLLLLSWDLIETIKWYTGYNREVILIVPRISIQDKTRNNGLKLEKNNNFCLLFIDFIQLQKPA